MPIFECTACHCIENTATSNYWWDVTHDKKPALCSECDPQIGKWHGLFPKTSVASVEGITVGANGFLYDSPEDARRFMNG